ncbi:isochorismatase family protein, partial [Bacillus cereus group sp. BC312]
MLNKENTGLIVVDIQGKLARLVSNSNELVSNCTKLVKGAQFLGLPIVWLEQNPDKLGKT